MPLGPRDNQTVRQIRNAYRNDECLGYIVHGPRGVGKTVWTCKVGSQLIGTIEEPEWGEHLRKWIRFTPAQYVDTCLRTDFTQIWLLWDDAGYWLNRMFWYENFVKEALRFSTLQRTVFTGLMLSTPSLEMMPSKLLVMEDVYRVKIIKMCSNEHAPNVKRREASIVRPWHSEFKSKSGCTQLYREWFFCHYPDDFYHWYQPVRKLYSLLAKVNMKRALERKAGSPMKVQGEEVLEALMKSNIIPPPEQLQELSEKIKQYALNIEIEKIRREDEAFKKEQAHAERAVKHGIDLITDDVKNISLDGEEEESTTVVDL